MLRAQTDPAGSLSPHLVHVYSLSTKKTFILNLLYFSEANTGGYVPPAKQRPSQRSFAISFFRADAIHVVVRDTSKVHMKVPG